MSFLAIGINYAMRFTLPIAIVAMVEKGWDTWYGHHSLEMAVLIWMICNIAFSELPTDETSRAQCGQTLRGHGNVTDLTEVTVINIKLVKWSLLLGHPKPNLLKNGLQFVNQLVQLVQWLQGSCKIYIHPLLEFPSFQLSTRSQCTAKWPWGSFPHQTYLPFFCSTLYTLFFFSLYKTEPGGKLDWSAEQQGVVLGNHYLPLTRWHYCSGILVLHYPVNYLPLKPL